jgi:hypothetical protein
MFDAQTSEDKLPIEATAPESDDIWLKPAELASRWRTEEMTLANHRSRGEGLPFLKKPGGGILYKLSDVLEAERSGMRGFSWARLSNALEALLELPAGKHEKLMKDLKVALK